MKTLSWVKPFNSLTKSSYVFNDCYLLFILQQLAMEKKLVPLYFLHYLQQEWYELFYWNNLKKEGFTIQRLFGKHMFKMGYCFGTMCILYRGFAEPSFQISSFVIYSYFSEASNLFQNAVLKVVAFKSGQLAIMAHLLLSTAKTYLLEKPQIFKKCLSAEISHPTFQRN